MVLKQKLNRGLADWKMWKENTWWIRTNVTRVKYSKYGALEGQLRTLSYVAVQNDPF